MNNALTQVTKRINDLNDKIIRDQKEEIHHLKMQVLYLKTKYGEITNYEQN